MNLVLEVGVLEYTLLTKKLIEITSTKCDSQIEYAKLAKRSRRIGALLLAMHCSQASEDDLYQADRAIDASASFIDKHYPNKIYALATRNWNSNQKVHEFFMSLVNEFGVVRYENADGDLDDKYSFETRSKQMYETMKGWFNDIQPYSGGIVWDNTYIKFGLDAESDIFQN